MPRWMLVGVLLLGVVLDLVMVVAGQQIQQMVGVSDEHVLDHLFLPVWAGWVTLYVVAAVVVLVDAIRRVRRRDLDGLQRSATCSCKLGAIPFFVVNLVLHLLFVVDVASTLVVAFRARQVLAAAHPA